MKDVNSINVIEVYREAKSNKIVGVLIESNSKQLRISLSDLYKLKDSGYTLSNAILTRSGVLRAKHGSLETKYINRANKSLRSYSNRKHYDGNTEKFGVTIRSVDYIAKYPKQTKDFSVFSEYVASSFMRKLGYNAHETTLYKDTDGRVAVLLKDFTSNGEELRSYKDTKQSSEFTDITDKYYTYDDILDMIKKHTKLDNNAKKIVIAQFWDMYMLDAILA